MNKVAVVSLGKESGRLRVLIRKKLEALIRVLNLKNVGVEVYLVGDEFMKKNVLAFPAPRNFPRPDIRKDIKYLGEIYLNPGYIERESLEIRNWKPRTSPAYGGTVRARLEIASQKLAYMLIHGFLHLLGYDHKKKNDRIEMEKKEKQLLKYLCRDTSLV